MFIFMFVFDYITCAGGYSNQNRASDSIEYELQVSWILFVGLW